MALSSAVQAALAQLSGATTLQQVTDIANRPTSVEMSFQDRGTSRETCSHRHESLRLLHTSGFSGAASARAQLKDETLLQTLPPGYKFGLQKTQNALTVQETIPENESLDNWTEMVTTRVFLGRRDINPDQFRIMMDSDGRSSAKTASLTTAN